MIRVVFLIRSLNRGGTERQLATLARSLDRSRFTLTVLTFYAGGSYAKEISDLGIPVISLDKRGRWDLLGFFWRLINELRQLKPQILYSFLVEPNTLTSFLKPFLPGTKIVWGIRAANVDFQHYGWFARLTFRLQVFLSRSADLVIYNSHAAREYHLAQGFRAKDSIVIHNGIDTDVFSPNRLAGTAVRQEWGIDPEAILIGVIGRLDPIKAHPTFIKAAGLLARHQQHARFVCVGQGPAKYLEELRALTNANQVSDRFTWAGERADMPAVYNAVDIVCSSSFGESLPNAIGEAMACDKPCVVTNVGDAAMLVGDTGLVVAPNNPEALAEGLKKCLEDLQRKLRPSPRQRIIDEFGVDRLAERTGAALSGLI